MMFEPSMLCCAGTMSGSRTFLVRVEPRTAVPASGFSLTELLVAVSVILMLMALLAAAISSAKSSHRHLATESLITKLDGIIGAQYASYANLNVDASSAGGRGESLRAIARGDLPDDWTIVAELAGKLATDPATKLTPAQRAYTAIWNAVENKPLVMQSHSSAECLFMIVMQGGIADCLDCRGLRSEIGDVDGDEMPEFLDAWGSPIEFVLWPSGLELPAGEGKRFFSKELPFDAVLPEPGEAAGGLMRPLIVSAGPDRESGLGSDASPLTASTAHLDNLTNFDQEATR